MKVKNENELTLADLRLLVAHVAARAITPKIIQTQEDCDRINAAERAYGAPLWKVGDHYYLVSDFYS